MRFCPQHKRVGWPQRWWRRGCPQQMASGQMTVLLGSFRGTIPLSCHPLAVPVYGQTTPPPTFQPTTPPAHGETRNWFAQVARPRRETPWNRSPVARRETALHRSPVATRETALHSSPGRTGNLFAHVDFAPFWEHSYV